jgi:hypothetical protein
VLLSSPEDYGLTEQQTLAHEVTDDPPSEFDAFWAVLREEVATLPSRWRGTIDGPIGQVLIDSSRAVQVVARLTMPGIRPVDRTETGAVPRPRGVVITVVGPPPIPHEAREEALLRAIPGALEEAPEPWLPLGLATLRLYVRGCGPSAIENAPEPEAWILDKLGVADSWIVRGAVADVVQAYRCARRHFGPHMPISLHGDSVGAGLAVIAAAQLRAMGDGPHRLALAHPDLGAWRWRTTRYCSGLGGQVNEMLVAARQDAARILETMVFFDAAYHARAVDCPALCKLSARDDVVPAPAAAAVFNAVGSGRKWPFVTSYGHFDGGLQDARRHARFQELHPLFLDPGREPEEFVAETAGHPEM